MPAKTSHRDSNDTPLHAGDEVRRASEQDPNQAPETGIVTSLFPGDRV